MGPTNSALVEASSVSHICMIAPMFSAGMMNATRAIGSRNSSILPVSARAEGCRS